MAKQVQYFPLSHPQQGIWYTEKLHNGTSISNIAATLRIKEAIDFNLLEEAVNIMVQKNDAIRMRVVEIDGQPHQYVADYKHQKIDFFDFTEQGLEGLFAWDTKLSRTPIPLIDVDLCYFAMFKISDIEAGIYAKMHHIIGDAWSIIHMANQVLEFYWQLKNGLTISLEPKPSYLEYVVAEQAYKCSPRFKRDYTYWNERFTDVPEITALKTRKSSDNSTEASRKTFVLPVKLARKIRQHCQETKTSIFAVFLASLAMYINRVTGKEDIIFGIPVLNRSNVREKDMVGMFISTVPLRIKVQDDENFETFAQKVTREWFAVLRHQRYPYDLLLKDVREKQKDVERLFDIVLSYQNAKLIKNEVLIKNEGRWHFNGYQRDALYIHINDREDDELIILDYDFLEQLFYSKEVEFIHDHFIRILWHALDNPQREICRIEMVSENEKQKILNEFNETKVDYPREKTVHQLFTEQAQKTPNKTAVICDDMSLTYQQLNEKANQLARTLRDQGVGRESVVGLLINRSLDMMVGILGVLKAGGAYLPLDIDYPQERLNYILQDSGTEILLTRNNLKRRVAFEGHTLCFEDPSLYTGSEANVALINESQDLIYVIYTSGSTGLPKGVMLEHRSVTNFIKGVSDVIDFSPDKTVLSVTTMSFDIFVLETLLPLTQGQTVVIATEEEQRIPRKMSDVINKHQVHMMQTTPSRMQLLLSEDARSCLAHLTDIMVGGETFPLLLLKALQKRTSANIYNMYGPTETTVWSTIKDLTSAQVVNIGRPIANTSVYILDKNSNLLPIGVPGELHIGGEGLARGYFKRPQLNREMFIPNPFVKGDVIYKTGDIARWFAQGEIEHIGRSDLQVKIRGYRIELEEIQNALVEHPDIKETIIMVIEDEVKVDKHLCAYYVANDTLSVRALRQHLAAKLPKFMIPQFFVKIHAIPLTPNGKIDRQALPEVTGDFVDVVDYVPPQTSIEQRVAELCAEMLGLAQIGMEDNFFDMGGDSLTIINFVARIYQVFGVDLPLREAYQAATIREIAHHISENKDTIHIEDDSLVFLKRGTRSDLNVFFIHAGNGHVGVYSELANHLEDEFSCWGLQFEQLQGYYPRNIDLTELAVKYIRTIKKVQPQGPYNIVGWCIGGTIAFEMVRLLEEKGESIRLLSLINPIAPQAWADVEAFTAQTEVAMTQEMMGTNCQSIATADEMDQIWEESFANFDHNPAQYDRIRSMIPDDIAAIIPEYEKDDIKNIAYYLNVLRTLHNARALYFPSQRINTTVHYFNATNDDVIITDKAHNIHLWNMYCRRPLQVYDIPDDHFSMFSGHQVISVAKPLNAILNRGQVKEEKADSLKRGVADG